MRYLTITAPDINNGLGCRVTLWVAGCKHACIGCQNKHTWKYDQGNMISDAYEKLDYWLDKAYIRGLTLSGGDPLCQDEDSLKELEGLITYVKDKYPLKDIWIYTGYTYDEIKKDKLKYKIVSLCDVLVDGMFDINKKDTTLPFRGSSNQNIIRIR